MTQTFSYCWCACAWILVYCIYPTSTTVTVTAYDGTGIVKQQPLTLGCNYTKTGSDFIFGFEWKNGDVTILSGAITPDHTHRFQTPTDDNPTLWKSGVFLGDYTSSLTIQLPVSSVIPQVAGQYSNIVSTLVGGFQDTATATVQYAPEVSSSFPNNKDVTENSSPNLDCSSGLAVGNPSDTSYTWTGPGGYSKSGSVLDRRVSRSQGGIYTCTARNSAGLSDSAQVNISVQYAPEVFSSFPNNKDVTENSNPNLDCSSGLTAGNPSDTSYTWTGPGGYSKSGSVLDRRVSRSQGGSYTCTARNSEGLTDSAQVNISVQYIDGPALTISPAQVTENASVHLECGVSSNPTVEMTISNLDNNTDLVNSEMTNTRQLNIDRAQCLHNGTFQCVVNNRALSRSETVTKELSVLCFPRHDPRKQHLTSVAAQLNETVLLVAEVIANPFPIFTWGRLEEEDLVPIRTSANLMVQGSELKSVLQIKVTSSKDYGQYNVKVQNTVGETLLKYQLTAKVENSRESCNVGLIAGVVTSICLLTLLLHVLFFLYRRGLLRQLPCFKREKGGQTNSTPVPDFQASASPYSDLDHINSDRQTYTELTTFQNNQDVAEPDSSVASASSAYENADMKKKDPVYINASST